MCPKTWQAAGECLVENATRPEAFLEMDETRNSRSSDTYSLPVDKYSLGFTLGYLVDSLLFSCRGSQCLPFYQRDPVCERSRTQTTKRDTEGGA